MVTHIALVGIALQAIALTTHLPFLRKRSDGLKHSVIGVTPSVMFIVVYMLIIADWGVMWVDERPIVFSRSIAGALVVPLTLWGLLKYDRSQMIGQHYLVMCLGGALATCMAIAENLTGEGKAFFILNGVTAFVLGCGLFVRYTPGDSAVDLEYQAKFRLVRMTYLSLWLAFPILWTLGPANLHLLTYSQHFAAKVILDFIGTGICPSLLARIPPKSWSIAIETTPPSPNVAVGGDTLSSLDLSAPVSNSGNKPASPTSSPGSQIDRLLGKIPAPAKREPSATDIMYSLFLPDSPRSSECSESRSNDSSASSPRTATFDTRSVTFADGQRMVLTRPGLKGTFQRTQSADAAEMRGALRSLSFTRQLEFPSASTLSKDPDGSQTDRPTPSTTP